MSYITLGKLIYQIRTEQKISLEKLGRGLCSKQALSDIERGNVQADKLLSDIVLQRLGKSTDKQEVILPWDAYHMEETRDRLEQFIQWQDKENAGKYRRELARLLGKEEGGPLRRPVRQEKEGRVREMYWHRILAEWAYWLDMEPDRARRELCMAVDLTLPDFWGQSPSCYVISTVEMENLLALARLELEMRIQRYETLTVALRREIWNERWQPADRPDRGMAAENMTLPGFLRECLQYIRMHFTDGQEQAVIFAKCAWLLSYIELEQGNVLEAYGMCEEAVEGLRDQGIFSFVMPVLERIIVCCRRAEEISEQADREKRMLSYAWQRDWTARRERYGHYLGALKRVRSKCGLSPDPPVSVFMKCYQKSYHLDYEFIRSERIAKGMTREEMVEGIYQSQKTLWQIEVKRNSPHERNFRLLMDKIDSDKGRYNAFVVSDSFEVLELKDEIDRCMARDEYERMEELIRQLEKRLDMGNAENQRIILHARNILEFRQGNVLHRDMLQKCWELLGKSYHITGGIERAGIPDIGRLRRELFYRAPMKAEMGFIDQIAVLLCRLKYKEEAKAVYEAVLSSMEKSDVALCYRYRVYALPLGNLAKLKNSVELSRRGIAYELSCGKMGSLGYAFMVWACAIEDDSPDRAESREMVLDSYYLCELSKNYKYREDIKKYYNERYGSL